MAAIETHAVHFDIDGLAVFNPEHPSIRILLDSAVSRLVLISLCAGQWLPEQIISSSTLVQVVRGRIAFVSGQSRHDVESGSLLQVDRRVPFRMGSVPDVPETIVLLTITPRPDFHAPDNLWTGMIPLVTESAAPASLSGPHVLLPARLRRRSENSPLDRLNALPTPDNSLKTGASPRLRDKPLPMVRTPRIVPSPETGQQPPTPE